MQVAELLQIPAKPKKLSLRLTSFYDKIDICLEKKREIIIGKETSRWQV